MQLEPYAEAIRKESYEYSEGMLAAPMASALAALQKNPTLQLNRGGALNAVESQNSPGGQSVCRLKPVAGT